MIQPQEVPKLALLVLVTTAAVTDIRTRRISNCLCVWGALSGLALQPRAALAGLALGFTVYFVLYLLHTVGAGDVKLMGAVGALAGWWGWLQIAALAAILGLPVALVLFFWPGWAKRGVPHGAVIAAASWLWIFYGWLGTH